MFQLQTPYRAFELPPCIQTKSIAAKAAANHKNLFISFLLKYLSKFTR